MKKTPDVEKTVRDIRRHTRKLPKSKSGLSSKACVAKTVLPSCVAVRASIPMCNTAGARNFWRRVKKRLSGDTVREATSDEVKTLRAETASLKEALAEVVMENRLLKKSVIGDGEDGI